MTQLSLRFKIIFEGMDKTQGTFNTRPPY